jgi:malate/lactate dehydrogenase
VTPFVAVIGGGDIGGATAQAIASLDCVREVRLIDAAPGVAAGKALDITVAAASEHCATSVVGSADVNGAAGAVAIVLADSFGNPSREWQGEEGLALVRRVWEFARTDGSVIVCAGTLHAELLHRAVRELHVDRRRIVGSAPAAFESAVRSIVGVALDGDGSRVSLMVLGMPPVATVACWSQATVNGAALTGRLSAAQIAAIESRLRRLWPPGPYTLGSAAARASEAIVKGSRTELTMAVALDGELNMRGVVTALPVRLGPEGVKQIIEPELSPQEAVRLVREPPA